jgi:hypothetical protein
MTTCTVPSWPSTRSTPAWRERRAGKLCEVGFRSFDVAVTDEVRFLGGSGFITAVDGMLGFEGGEVAEEPFEHDWSQLLRYT